MARTDVKDYYASLDHELLLEQLARRGLYYVRYMDDILVLAPTRWKLREAVRVLQQGFADLRLATHPDKTFIGRIERGFDFLGYRFSRGPLRLAAQTVRHFGERLLRLYEQQRTAPEGAVRLGDYVTRWLRWTRAGLGGLYRVGLSASGFSETQQACQPEP